MDHKPNSNKQPSSKLPTDPRLVIGYVLSALVVGICGYEAYTNYLAGDIGGMVRYILLSLVGTGYAVGATINRFNMKKKMNS